MLDLGPVTAEVARVVEGIRDEQLTAPSPCPDYTVADLLEHLGGLSVAFRMAAEKSVPPGSSRPPSVDGSRLGDDWRTRIPRQLAELAQAWRAESAWTGMTEAGSVQLPGEIAGLVAVNEVLVHGWDLAAATEQKYAPGPDAVAASGEFVRASVEENPEGTPGLFGPPVPVPEDASPLDRLIAQTGRDPGWRPA